MKMIRSYMPAILGVVVAVVYAITKKMVWWDTILAILIAIGCFYGLAQRCDKTWTWILAMGVGIFLIRFVAIPVFIYCLEVVILILTAALKVVGWGFSANGIIVGIIILVLVLMFLKALFS